MNRSETTMRPNLRVINNPALEQQKADDAKITLVASGKGGVGKTWFSITLCQSLAEKDKNILLFDGDLGLANVDIQLGLMPEYDLAQVVNSHVALEDAVIPYPAGGFDILAGQSGSGQLSELNSQRMMYLKESLKKASRTYDQVFIDLGAGIGDNVKGLSDIAYRCIVVVTDEPTSLTDAYALIKVTHLAVPEMDMEIVVNQAESEIAGHRTYNTLLRVCENFLDISPKLLGVIRRDTHVKDAICNQTSILTRFPTCNASKDVKKIAQVLGV